MRLKIINLFRSIEKHICSFSLIASLIFRSLSFSSLSAYSHSSRTFSRLHPRTLKSLSRRSFPLSAHFRLERISPFELFFISPIIIQMEKYFHRT